MVRTRTKRMIFGSCSMAQSKEEMAFSPLESLATVLCKLSTKEFASERVLRQSAIWRHIQSVFAVTCLNQNFQHLSLLPYSFQIANALLLLLLHIFIVIKTMTFDVVYKECIVFARGACMRGEMHPNCDRISLLPVISWPKMAD